MQGPGRVAGVSSVLAAFLFTRDHTPIRQDSQDTGQPGYKTVKIQDSQDQVLPVTAPLSSKFGKEVRIQDSQDTRQPGYKTVRIQDSQDERQSGCKTVMIQDS